MKHGSFLSAALVVCLTACSSSEEGGAAGGVSSHKQPDAGASEPAANPNSPRDTEPDTAPAEPGLHSADDKLVFSTDKFSIAAGQEHYVCWATHVPESFKVSAYEYQGRPSVHHALFYAVAAADEPEAFTECEDVTFKASWLPLYGSGAGKTGLTFPQGVAQSLQPGSQLLVQLHLQNTTANAITDSATLVMRRSSESDPLPVQMGVIGNFDVNLPPGETSQVIADCDIRSDIRLIGFWPHMHRLGTALTLDIGESASSMSKLYERNPYMFDQQTIDSMDMRVPNGSHARVTCNYRNDGANAVSYGESTNNEMCFLLTFTAGQPMAPCLSGKIPAAVAGQLP